MGRQARGLREDFLEEIIFAAIGKITGQASLEMEYSRVVESAQRVGSKEEVWEISLDCGFLSLLFSISTSFKQ